MIAKFHGKTRKPPGFPSGNVNTPQLHLNNGDICFVEGL